MKRLVARGLDVTELGTQGAVDVRTVRVGEARIGTLTVEGVAITNPGVQAELHGVSVVVEIRPSFTWRLRVAGIERSGTVEPPAIHLQIRRDLVTTGLPGGVRAVEVGALTLHDLTTRPEELRSVNLGAVVVRGMKAAAVESEDLRPAAPLPGPPVDFTALSVGPIALGGDHGTVTVRGASAASVEVGALPLPGLTIESLALPPLDWTPVHLDGVVVDGPAADRSVGDDDGHVQWRLGLAVTARLEIAELVLRVDGELTADRVRIEGLTVPLTIEDLTLGDLNLAALDVGALTVGSPPPP